MYVVCLFVGARHCPRSILVFLKMFISYQFLIWKEINILNIYVYINVFFIQVKIDSYFQHFLKDFIYSFYWVNPYGESLGSLINSILLFYIPYHLNKIIKISQIILCF